MRASVSLVWMTSPPTDPSIARSPTPRRRCLPIAPAIVTSAAAPVPAVSLGDAGGSIAFPGALRVDRPGGDVTTLACRLGALQSRRSHGRTRLPQLGTFDPDEGVWARGGFSDGDDQTGRVSRTKQVGDHADDHRREDGSMVVRYWTLVHDGETCPMVWDDGERLLALTTDVRSGAAEPQDFTFTPRGCVDVRSDKTIAVRADQPLDLITEYSTTAAPA
jgi:hypothetical protein